MASFLSCHHVETAFACASWPFALAAIFVKIYSTTDALLLEFYLGESAVGMYSIAYKLTYAFQFFPMAFVAAAVSNI